MKKRLNILIISDDKSTAGSKKVDAQLLVRKLQRDGLWSEENNFSYIAWSKIESYERVGKNIEIIHTKDCSNPVLRDFFCSRSVLSAMAKLQYKPDVIVVYDCRHLLHAKRIKETYGGMVIEFITNLPSDLAKTRSLPRLRSLYYSFIERITRDIPSLVFVINETTKIYAMKAGIPEEKIKVFSPNVIKIEEPFIKESKKGEIRKKYNIGDSKKIILSVGRLAKEKGFDALIRSFVSINDPRLVLIIVGEGKERAYLESLAGEYALDGRIIFAGFEKHADIWKYYKDADLFILLSLSEALGLVFWEAMYMNVPVIGARTGGIIETIGENEERGFFWDEGSGIESFKRNIDACCNKTKEVEDKVKRAHEYVLGKISSNNAINDLIG